MTMMRVLERRAVERAAADSDWLVAVLPTGVGEGLGSAEDAGVDDGSAGLFVVSALAPELVDSGSEPAVKIWSTTIVCNRKD
jgi:hypothetical protein